MYRVNMGEAEKNTEMEQLDRYANMLKWVSAAFVVVSLGTIIAGILTMVYASSDLNWPFSSASGIWTGVMALVTGVIGSVAFRKFNSAQPRDTRGLVGGFYGMANACISLSIMHTRWSGNGIGKCAANEDACKVDDHDELLVAQVFGVVFGSLLIIMCVSNTIFMATGCRLKKLTGMQPGDCCYGCHSKG